MALNNLPDWLAQILFGYRHAQQDGAAVDDSDTLNFLAPLTATFNGSTGLVDVGLSGTAPAPVTVSTLTFSPGYDGFTQSVRLTTTDATPHTLATIAVGVGQQVLVDFKLVASIGTVNGVPGINSPLSIGGSAIFAATAFRLGSGSVQADISTTNTIGAPFLPPATASASGLVGFVVSGTNVLIQVNGFAVSEAWTSGHAYSRGDASMQVGHFVTTGGNVYMCTTSGTASGSAPSGTGTGLGTGAKFDYVAAGSVVPVQWTMGAPRVTVG